MIMSTKITDSRFLVKSFLTQTLEKYVQGLSSNHVLDLGCGEKPYKSLFSNAQSYVGIDYRSKSAEVRGVGEHLPFREESFDTVICTQVLEHVENPKLVLEELRRVLTDDGLVVLSTHGFWIEGHEKVDYWRWTIQGLRKIFEDSGFKIVESHSMESYSSFLQFASLYIPGNIAGLLFQVLINLSGLFLRGLRGKGPNLPIVHIIKAIKLPVKQKENVSTANKKLHRRRLD
jgi:SAM-dependent methyltransferase